MKRWRVRFAPGEGPPWMQGREAIIFAGRLVPPPGRPLATAADGTVALAEAGGRVRAGFHLEAASDYLLHERYRAPARPITRFLPFHYHRVPGGVPVAVLNVHPDPQFAGSSAGLAAYAEFLERVRAHEPWIATPRELWSLISEAVAA